jgi:uncharacterized membrane protein
MLMIYYRLISWIFIIIGVVLVFIAAINLASSANYEPFLDKNRSILTCGTMSLIGGFLALCILRSSKDS